CCDAPGGPDLADEPIGFGTPGEQMRELCQLLDAQPGRGPGRWLAVPGFDISCARPLQPAANRALGNAHGLRDGGARPALLMQCPRSQSTPFAPVPWRARICCTHGAGNIAPPPFTSLRQGQETPRSPNRESTAASTGEDKMPYGVVLLLD